MEPSGFTEITTIKRNDPPPLEDPTEESLKVTVFDHANNIIGCTFSVTQTCVLLLTWVYSVAYWRAEGITWETLYRWLGMVVEDFDYDDWVLFKWDDTRRSIINRRKKYTSIDDMVEPGNYVVFDIS